MKRGFRFCAAGSNSLPASNLSQSSSIGASASVNMIDGGSQPQKFRPRMEWRKADEKVRMASSGSVDFYPTRVPRTVFLMAALHLNTEH